MKARRIGRSRTGSGGSSRNTASTVLYTAPTAIRAFIRWGDEWLKKHDLSSLRLLGTVGEPINPEAWMWYHEGDRRRPLPDRRYLVADRDRRHHDHAAARRDSHQARHAPRCRFSASMPRSWMTRERKSARMSAANWSSASRGRRCCATIYGDKERYKKPYWSEVKGSYFTGDGARRDKDGYFWIVGRIDDVLNVAGHRLGTSEIESALVSHANVAEAAVVGRPDELKGQGVVAFVTVKGGVTVSNSLKHGIARARRPFTSARSRSRTRSVSPKRCRRPAAERSCGGLLKEDRQRQNRHRRHDDARRFQRPGEAEREE